MKSILLASAALLLPIGLLVASPAKAPAGPSAPAAASTFKIDPGHSSVVFRVKHMGAAWFYGRFNDVSGTIVVNKEDPSKSSIAVEIATASIDSNSADRDKHLKSPDFFSVKEFPVMTFESTEVEGAGDDLKVTGDLTVRGVTKEITFDAVHVGEADTPRGFKSGYEAVFTIKRSDFGIKYGLPNALGDEVRLIVSLEADRQ